MTSYPDHIIKLAKNPKNFGRMNDPTASAVVKGPCGDEIEIYLVIENGIISEIKYYTDGCISTVVCGEIVAQLAHGKHIDDALGISPKDVKAMLKGLPESQSHCSILAVSALYRAIADYLLKM